MQVVVFGPGANGDTTPMRTLAGATTQLTGPVGVTLDARRNLVVADYAGNSLATIAPLVPLAKPGKVRKLKISGKRTAKRRTVSWKPPATDGGTPITGYRVVVRKHHRTVLVKKLTAHKTSVRLARHALPRGRLKVRVTARNAVGTGPATRHRFRVR
jgi:hypothetical protein